VSEQTHDELDQTVHDVVRAWLDGTTGARYTEEVARAVLAVPAIADALQGRDAARYRLRAEVRWLETQPASEWATTRQVAMLDVIRLLDGGPWVEREHVTDGERCWCDPQVETVPAKKSATEAADSSIEGNDQ
jgi:hypothetical protein